MVGTGLAGYPKIDLLDTYIVGTGQPRLGDDEGTPVLDLQEVLRCTSNSLSKKTWGAPATLLDALAQAHVPS